MDIYYDNKVESVELDFLMILANDKFVFDKRKIDLNNNENKSSKLEENILKFMIKNGTYKEDYYEYKIDNKTFKYYDEINRFTLERKYSDSLEVWRMNCDDNYLVYSNDNQFDISDKIVLNFDDSFKKNKILYDRFYNYLDKYILSKSN